MYVQPLSFCHARHLAGRWVGRTRPITQIRNSLLLTWIQNECVAVCHQKTRTGMTSPLHLTLLDPPCLPPPLLSLSLSLFIKKTQVQKGKRMCQRPRLSVSGGRAQTCRMVRDTKEREDWRRWEYKCLAQNPEQIELTGFSGRSLPRASFSRGRCERVWLNNLCAVSPAKVFATQNARADGQ